jgi:hypothetical protein
MIPNFWISMREPIKIDEFHIMRMPPEAPTEGE